MIIFYMESVLTILISFCVLDTRVELRITKQRTDAITCKTPQPIAIKRVLYSAVNIDV